MENAAAGPLWADAADGVYAGKAESLHGSVIEVAFAVEVGKLTNIEVLSGDMFMAMEQLQQYTAVIVETQDVGVDVIAEATDDCQAIGAVLCDAFG